MAAAGPYGDAMPGGRRAEALPELDVPEPGHQHRLTVLLRLLLLIPQFIVVFVLAVIAFFVTVAGWFSALVLGRLPDPIWAYLRQYLGYETRVNASAVLLTDRYPPFRLGPPVEYPVQVEVERTDLNRLAVLFRIILMIPAAIVSYVVWAGWWSVAFLCWLVVLIMGRCPRPLFEATSAVLRYRMRMGAYTMMLTSAYPKRLFGDEGAPLAGTLEGTGGPGARSATRPLVLNTGGKALLVIFIVLGALTAIGNGVGSGTEGGTGDGTGTYSTAPAIP
ncbi:DUF4389 domain-containing protein [Streptomyces sp. ODS28]|uniref:DUF4389 domain-containing protein n=1 Tax=Streptomyces sp. ODS28 TaxID=3136688 RepID=UPI0031F097F6